MMRGLIALLLGVGSSLGCSSPTGSLGDAAASDSGAADSGAPDSGASFDSGAFDSGAFDSGAADSGTPDTGLEGRAVGESCEQPADCRSADSPFRDLPPSPCITVDGSTWEGGYCTDYCTLPDDPFVPPALARADCPEGAVCLPRSPIPEMPVPSSEIGACLKECQTDADCREAEGYYCRHEFGPYMQRVTFENGYCAPLHCQTRGCTASFICGC